MKLNEILFDLRRKAGLSQEELAERLGVSRQAVGKWENAAAVPDVDKLIALSEVFGVSVGALLGLDAPEDGKVRVDTGELEALLKNYAGEQKALAERHERAMWDNEENARIQRRRLWLALGAVCAAAAVVGIVLGVRLARLNDRIDLLRSEIDHQHSELTYDISDLQDRIADILKKQASLFSDARCDVTGYDAQTGEVTVTISVTPKALTDGTALEFLLSEVSTGREYRAAGERQGLSFTAEQALPQGTYELTAILDEGGTRSQESLWQYTVSPIGLAANYRFDWLEGPDYADGTWSEWEDQYYRPQGLLAIWCSPGEWPARGLESVELVLYKNGAEYARQSLDTGDAGNWHETYEVPEEYLLGPQAYAYDNETTPLCWSAPEGGLLFAAEFDLGEIPVADRDKTRLELLVTDSLGLVYRCEEMEERSFRDGPTTGSASGSSASGGLSLDYGRYE